MTKEERLRSIQTKAKLLVTLSDDFGNGEANLLTVANDMNWLVEQVQEKEEDCEGLRSALRHHASVAVEAEGRVKELEDKNQRLADLYFEQRDLTQGRVERFRDENNRLQSDFEEMKRVAEIHRSNELRLEKENDRMYKAITVAVAHFRHDAHREGMKVLENILEVENNATKRGDS